MPDGVHTDSSLVHASKAASVVLESAAAPPPEDSALARSNFPFLHPNRAAPATGTAGAAAGETVDHFQDKDTTRSCSSPRGRNNNNNSSGLNNNGESMKCLSAIEYNMKANERYFLLNKNTFQEIFDATLYEMTGAAAPVSRRVNAAQPTEDYDRESISLRSGSTNSHCTRDQPKIRVPECSGVYTESSGKKAADVNSGRRKSDLFLCQTTQQDYEPTAQHKVSASPGMLCTETGGIERGAQDFSTSRMNALNDITNDHQHTSLAINNRGISTATESTAPSHFLPPMSPLDIESENEPLDLTVCRSASKTSSVDATSQSSAEESSASGSPINLTYTDNHPRSREVQNSFTVTAASEGNDKNSLSDSDEDEDIDLVEVVSTSSASGVGNGDGSTYSSVSATETSVVCKHSASDERAAGWPDCCWQPTSNAPNEPSCHHRPRGATGATTNTKQARSIGDEIQVDPSTTSCSVDTTREQGSFTRRKSTMTGGSGGMATPRMKPRATEKWGALSKATVYDLVEEMVLKMDEEEGSDASRSPPPPKVQKSDSSGEKDNSKLDSSKGNNTSGSRPQMNESVPSTSSVEIRTVSSSPGKSAGRPRYNNNNNNNNNNLTSSKPVMQSYDQSLSPVSQPSASHESPKSAPALNLPQLVKPGAKPEENSCASTELVGNTSDKRSQERGKQCWVALNKMVVFDIVDSAILSEAKENNNNVTDGGHDQSRSTTPDSVSSRSTSGNLDDVGSDSKKTAVSGCDSQDKSNKSRKRKCDSSSTSNASTPQSSGKYVEETFKDFPLNFERVSMNESCAVPERPRSSDCASGDINTDILPIKQRRKSAEINRSYSAETYFDGNRQTGNPFTDKSFTSKGGNDQSRKQAKERSPARGKEWESQAAGRQTHDRMSPYYKSVTAGQSMAGRGGQRSDGAGDRKTPRSRGTPSPPGSRNINNKRKSPTSLSSQHSGGSPVHDLSMNNVSSIMHLVQSQRTTIDYGRNEILAAKQANSTKLGLHSSTSPTHQAPAAIRSRCGVSVNNQYALNDTRDNNGDSEIRRKRTKVDSSSTTNNNEPMTSAYRGLDACKAVSLFSANERGDLTKDARSSPRLGWIAVSKPDVQKLFNSVVDIMMAADAEEAASPQKSRESATKPHSGSPSASPAPPGGRSASPSVSPASSLGSNSTGSSPRRQQIDCENGSNRLENESTGPCSPPSPAYKASFIRTQSPSSSSDNLDSEHMIVDPGSPGDMFLDGEGKDSKSSKHKTFKWKSSLLMRVHEESQTTPLVYNKKEIGSTSSSSNSPSSESGSEKSEKGLGHSSSTTNITEEAGGQGRHHNTSSRSSRRSGKKGNSHSHARAK